MAHEFNQKGFSIRSKLFFGFSLVLLILILAIASNIYQINLTKRYSAELQRASIPATLAALEISKEVNASVADINNWLLTKNAKYKVSLNKSMHNLSMLRVYLNSISKTWDNPKTLGLWNKIQVDLDKLSTIKSTLTGGTAPPVLDQKTLTLQASLVEKMRHLQHLLGSTNLIGAKTDTGFVIEQQRQLEANTGNFVRDIELLQINQWGILIVGIIITVIIAWVTSRLITTPIRKAINIAQALAAGRRDVAIHTSKTDETGRLLHALGEMQLSIRTAEDKLRDSEKDVQQLLGQLERRVRQYRDILQHISSGDLTKRFKIEGDDVLSELGGFLNTTTQGLSDITREIAAAIYKMSENVDAVRQAVLTQSESVEHQSHLVKNSVLVIDGIKETSKNMLKGADDLSRTAQNTQLEGQKGLESVVETQNSMRDIRTGVKDISHSIVTLVDRMNKIAEITEAVNAFAERSKLLALNASIEAVKAGEAGKGFSVVASEVKELADQSQQATRQVQSILNELNTAATDAVHVSELGMHGVDRGLKQVEHAGEVILHLSNALNDTVKTNNEIVATIQREVDQVDQLSASMLDIQSASGKVLDVTNQTNLVANEIARIAEQLNSSITRYKLDDKNKS